VTAAAQLVQSLRARGVHFEPEGERLRVRPASALLPDEVKALRQHKPEILVLLTRSPGTCAVQSSVADRARVFRAQVEAYWRELGEAWSQAKHLPIPPLAFPDVTPLAGTCELCGDPLSLGCAYRCSPCVDAINLMLAELREDDPR